MKVRHLFEGDEFFWESIQDHGEWEPRGDRLVSTRDPRISVSRDRRMYYRDIYTRLDYADAEYTELLRFDSDPEVQDRWCSRSIGLLRYASEAVQLAAVQENGYAIGFIENPSEEIKIATVQMHNWAIKYIKNPSEAVQLAAVLENGNAIQHIENPSEAVKRAARR